MRATQYYLVVDCQSNPGKQTLLLDRKNLTFVAAAEQEEATAFQSTSMSILEQTTFDDTSEITQTLVFIQKRPSPTSPAVLTLFEMLDKVIYRQESSVHVSHVTIVDYGTTGAGVVDIVAGKVLEPTGDGYFRARSFLVTASGSEFVVQEWCGPGEKLSQEEGKCI